MSASWNGFANRCARGVVVQGMNLQFGAQPLRVDALPGQRIRQLGTDPRSRSDHFTGFPLARYVDTPTIVTTSHAGPARSRALLPRLRS